MSNELRAKLMATPAVKLANIGLGEHAYDPGMKILHSLSQRRIWIRQGLAMQDGSFPIPNVAHLKYALEAYEFAENRRKTQRWITRRAKNLSRIDLLPASWQARAVVAAAGDEDPVHTGAMIAIYPPPDIAEILAGPKATDEPAEELHVTLAFLGEAADYTSEQIVALTAAIAIAMEDTSPLEASVGGFGTFVNSQDQGDPQWYSINCPGLAKFRSKLVDVLAEQGGFELPTDYDFVPHMTVRYGAPNVTAIPAGGEKPWPVNEVYLVMAGNRMPLPFENEAEELPGDDLEPEVEMPEPESEDLPGDDAGLKADFAADHDQLKQYWLVGEGAAKWNSWTELYHHLSKYMIPEMAKRTAAQWFFERHGYWPGDKRNH